MRSTNSAAARSLRIVRGERLSYARRKRVTSMVQVTDLHSTSLKSTLAVISLSPWQTG
ncbi:Uncharacterised protein [Mycobacteroides abscessus subsp. abscessus]|nr:Uncharacterised protein [Mycobacteroides abscessus subsp. abscessus]